MRKKIGIVAAIVVLTAVIAGSQKAGEFLIKNSSEEVEETAGKAAKAEEENVTVLIDAGHGGLDAGKVGVNGALEKDINLEIALKLKKNLEQAGVNVLMSREDGERLADSNVEDLKKRVALVNEEKPALTVSVHQNSYTSEGVHGAQVFYYSHSKEGENAAKIIQESMLALDPENTKQAKANDTYYMLKKTEAPLVIVECGFLSNRAEADKLTTEEYQQKVAEAICVGVLKCLGKYT